MCIYELIAIFWIDDTLRFQAAAAGYQNLQILVILSCMSYLDTYILILRANKKKEWKIFPNMDIILDTGSTLQSHFKLLISIG